MRLNVSLLSAILFCMLLSCEKDKGDPVIDQSALTGTWQEYETGMSFAGTTHRITFNNDGTFRMIYRYFTDVLNSQDSCTSIHHGYSMGTFSIAHSLISFNGNYCDERYLGVVPNCEGKTVYETSYYCTVSKDDLVMGVNYPNEGAMVTMKRE
jgi:hypothetical protein